MVKPHYIVVSAKINNEAPYLVEWLEFYIAQGIRLFFIYDDNSKDNPKEKLQPYIDKGIVIYNTIPKNNFDHIYKTAKEHGHLMEWLAPIDLDEFVHSTNDKTWIENVQELDRKGVAAISLNWRNFGGNGHLKYEDKPVRERFTRHAKREYGLNFATKSMVKVEFMTFGCAKFGSHRVATTATYHTSSGMTVAQNQKKYAAKIRAIWGPYQNSIFPGKTGFQAMRPWVVYPEKESTIIMDHYKTKSLEEFQGKCTRVHHRYRYTKAIFDKYQGPLNEVSVFENEDS